MDLDNFKNINDSLGHDIGDILLCEISKKIIKYIDKKNKVFRTGGDEFAIVLTHLKDQSNKIAQDIISIVNEPIYAHKHTLKVGISIGIAKYTDEDKSIVSLLKHADIAMYEAKKRGKNKYRHYTKELSEITNKKAQVEQRLHNAIENNEFYMVYQPKYNIKTKEIKAIEALIRWENSDLGLIPPDYFIPIAEEMEVINDIGEFVFRKACEDFVSFKELSEELDAVSINVSAAQLLDEKILKNFKNIISSLPIDINNVRIEITETHIMQNMQANIKIIKEMYDAGFKIEIDDFGTGYSSLNYLKKMPISNLKIDKSFIDNICTDKEDIEIIKAIIAISKSFNYDVIAEGIETKEQEDILLEMGVKYGQGYLFSKPKRKKDLLEFIKKSSII